MYCYETFIILNPDYNLGKKNIFGGKIYDFL
jgi:hypothetical protein